MNVPDSAGFVDYYELLGVHPSAETTEIRRAYILKAKEYHPDAGGSAKIMRLLNKAYKTLRDSSEKAAYDMLHSFHTGSAMPGEYNYNDNITGRTAAAADSDAVDAFLDTLLEEYRNGPPKPRQGVRQWFKRIF